jgi:hypothetical protein
MDSGRYIGDYRQPDRDEGDLDGTEVGKLREEDRWSFSPSSVCYLCSLCFPICRIGSSSTYCMRCDQGL